MSELHVKLTVGRDEKISSLSCQLVKQVLSSERVESKKLRSQKGRKTSSRERDASCRCEVTKVAIEQTVNQSLGDFDATTSDCLSSIAVLLNCVFT